MSARPSVSNGGTARTAPVDQKPPAFIKPFFKLPLILYRAGLGRLLGTRFMMLTHRGRRSGRVYQSVLAVAALDRETGRIDVVSPWNSSNWIRNIQAAPALQVETAGLRYVPSQRFLAPEEIAALFLQFRREHPVFSRLVARIPGWNIDSTYEEFLVLARNLRGVSFVPSKNP